MQVLIIFAALSLLMAVAYRGASVIVFAPLAAFLPLLLTDPALILPVYSGVFMERLAGFMKLYFPVFLLGAIFGKLMEVSGFARAIIQAVLRFVGPGQAMAAVMIVGALLTYGGVSLFVVAFAVYPFGAELFRGANIPKRLLPATIGLGAFTFTMDALPGTPQIQNIIPTTFFNTTAWAAPRLGIAGGVFVLVIGYAFLEWRRRVALRSGEGYGVDVGDSAPVVQVDRKASALIAACPLVMVGLLNLWFTSLLPATYGKEVNLKAAGFGSYGSIEVSRLSAIWAVECALVISIGFVLVWVWKAPGLAKSISTSVMGAMLAGLNTGSEYGFGAVISSLPGFQQVSQWLSSSLHDTLINVAVTTNILAGVTGSASGGMSIALAAMSETYLKQANAAGIPPEVLHRVAAMASGGMDSLPHNGALITLLAVTGLTHREAYPAIFGVTVIKTMAVFFVIALYYVFGIV